jgi:hypothetical protein
MSWEPWSKADERGLARYVLPSAVEGLRLPQNRLDLAQQRDGRPRLTKAIYETLLEQEIRYAPEKYQAKLETQLIRTPKEILEPPGEGTCLDLAVLFCGLCLGNDLLPLLVVLDGHALAAVSLSQGRSEWESYGRKERASFEKGLLKDAAVLQQLAEDQVYLFVECTGFAESSSLDSRFPEGQARTNGLLSFEKAVIAGKAQLEQPSRPFQFALDVAALQEKWNFKPFELTKEEQGMAKKTVNTGGGANIEGTLTVGGDFVGRDKVTHGDEVKGDKVGGDKITVGDISGSQGVAIGRGARATVTTGVDGSDLAKLFAAVYQGIKDRPDDPNVDKQELQETVKKVEEEAAKGENANPTKVNRWLKLLADVAPDIVGGVVSILTSPASAVSGAVQAAAKMFVRS